MKHRISLRGISLALAVTALIGTSALLSGCEAVAGAGQDVSAVGHGVTNGAERTQSATHAP